MAARFGSSGAPAVPLPAAPLPPPPSAVVALALIGLIGSTPSENSSWLIPIRIFLGSEGGLRQRFFFLFSSCSSAQALRLADLLPRAGDTAADAKLKPDELRRRLAPQTKTSF